LTETKAGILGKIINQAFIWGTNNINNLIYYMGTIFAAVFERNVDSSNAIRFANVQPVSIRLN